jgi:predicted transcriptional regulator YdeE
MNKFFVSNKIYKKRIDICKSCEHYFKITGQCKKCLCFMKIKTRISAMECPEQKWLKTEEVKPMENLPKELEEAVMEIYPKIKLGRAPNHTIKQKMIELYNTIYNSKYDKNTSCGSCLQTALNGIKDIYNKIKKNER